MKITVRIDDIEITVDEQFKSDKNSTFYYSDQTEYVQETLKVMAEQCIKLINAKNQTK